MVYRAYGVGCTYVLHWRVDHGTAHPTHKQAGVGQVVDRQLGLACRWLVGLESSPSSAPTKIRVSLWGPLWVDFEAGARYPGYHDGVMTRSGSSHGIQYRVVQIAHTQSKAKKAPSLFAWV